MADKKTNEEKLQEVAERLKKVFGREVSVVSSRFDPDNPYSFSIKAGSNKAEANAIIDKLIETRKAAGLTKEQLPFRAEEDGNIRIDGKPILNFGPGESNVIDSTFKKLEDPKNIKAFQASFPGQKITTDKIDPKVAEVVGKALAKSPESNKQVVGELITTRLRQKGAIGELSELVEANKKAKSARKAIEEEYGYVGLEYKGDKIVKVEKRDAKGNVKDITAAVKLSHGDELKALEDVNQLRSQFFLSVKKGLESNDRSLLSDIGNAIEVISSDEKAAKSIINSIKESKQPKDMEGKVNGKQGMEVASVDFNEASKAPPLPTPTNKGHAMPSKGWTQG